MSLDCYLLLFAAAVCRGPSGGAAATVVVDVDAVGAAVAAAAVTDDTIYSTATACVYAVTTVTVDVADALLLIALMKYLVIVQKM